MDRKNLPLYDQALFCDAFEERRTSGSLRFALNTILGEVEELETTPSLEETLSPMRELIRVYRQRGAHPFFIQQAIRLCMDRFSRTLRESIMEAVNKNLERSFSQRQQVPGSSTLRLVQRLSSRLYDGKLPIELEQGILSGAITELEAEVMIFAGSDGSKEADTIWRANKAEVFRLVLGHPAADIVTLATLLRASFSLDNIRKTMATVEIPMAADPYVQFFLRERIQQLGISEVIRHTLETWSDQRPVTWEIFCNLFNELQFSGKPWGTQALQTLLTIKETGDPQQKYAARQVLHLHSLSSADLLWVVIPGSTALTMLIQTLREELSENPEAGEALRSWMGGAVLSIKVHIIFMLLLRRDDLLAEQATDIKSQSFLEEVFGSGAWDVICKAWEKRVQEIQASESYLSARMDQSALEYQNMWDMIRNMSKPEKAQVSDLPAVQQRTVPQKSTGTRRQEWSALLAQIEELLSQLPEQQASPFKNRLTELRAQTRQRSSLAWKLLQEVKDFTLPMGKREASPSPTNPEVPQPAQEDIGNEGIDKDASPLRIPPSLVPAGLKNQDLRRRLLRTGWKRRSGRAKHLIYTKEGEEGGSRTFGMSQGTKNTRTVDRFALATALSSAGFTIEEVEELFQ
jgi:hypothetical protein